MDREYRSDVPLASPLQSAGSPGVVAASPARPPPALAHGGVGAVTGQPVSSQNSSLMCIRMLLPDAFASYAW
jgi:hypothetical protein